jgi:hypothetical protein
LEEVEVMDHQVVLEEVEQMEEGMVEQVVVERMVVYKHIKKDIDVYAEIKLFKHTELVQ